MNQSSRNGIMASYKNVLSSIELHKDVVQYLTRNKHITINNKVFDVFTSRYMNLPYSNFQCDMVIHNPNSNTYYAVSVHVSNPVENLDYISLSVRRGYNNNSRIVDVLPTKADFLNYRQACNLSGSIQFSYFHLFIHRDDVYLISHKNITDFMKEHPILDTYSCSYANNTRVEYVVYLNPLSLVQIPEGLHNINKLPRK